MLGPQETYKDPNGSPVTSHSSLNDESINNMHSTQIAILLVAFASFTVANPNLLAAGKDFYAVPRYEYKYGVADKLTGDQKTAYETREGDITRGSYSLVQPDGILRTVEYVVDPIHGFQAKVINTGAAVHAVKAAPVAAVAPVGYAAKPFVGHGFGGYGHAGVVAKPAAVAYTQSVGPVAFGGYGHGGYGHGGYGHGGFGYGGFHGGY